MNYGIRLGLTGIAAALVLIYGCRDENVDGSPSAVNSDRVTLFAEDFTDGVRRDRLVVEDERHARVETRTSTGPALALGPTTARTAGRFSPSGRTEVRFDLGVPVHPAGDAFFLFFIDGFPETLFEIGFDLTGRVLIFGLEMPIVLSGPGNHPIVFVLDQFGDAHWFIDGALVLSRPGAPLSPFGLGMRGGGSSGFIVDNVRVTAGP